MKIIFTSDAEKRLRDIFNYYTLNAGRKVAWKIVNEIIKEVEILETNPKIGL